MPQARTTHRAPGGLLQRDRERPTDRPFPSYEVVRRVGQGGLGVVFEARRLCDQAPVPIKALRPEFRLHSAATALFWRGVGINRRLRHPRVVPVLDSGESFFGPFCVMPWIAGTTLREFLALEGPISPARAGQLAGQLAAILIAVHDQGVIHGDLTSVNVLVDGAGEVWLTDFDLAQSLEPEFPTTRHRWSSTATPTPERTEIPTQSDLALDSGAFRSLLAEIATATRPSDRTFPENSSGEHPRQSGDEPPIQADFPENVWSLLTICGSCAVLLRRCLAVPEPLATCAA